ncbi:hypothetical protein QQZ08_009816 [Neonectria magnoliae]|uniref:Transcription factor domain-containing protein n=1 Tax=Neonectria magnoliae TaxID=2732573 RepID=A0ABR1HLX1_9HYPO
MQHIAERAYIVLRSTEYQDQVSIVYRAPLEMAINSARRELDSFVKMQPEVVKQNKIFWSHYHAFLIRLYEPVLLMKASSITDSDSLPTEPFQRTEALWKCVQCCSQFFDHHFTIPAASLSATPVTVSGVVTFSIVTISRIMLLDPMPDWEPAMARRRLDMDKVLRRMSDQFEEADRVAQELGRRRRILDDGTSVFLKYSFKARWIRQWFNSKMPPEQQPQPQEQQQQQQQPTLPAALPVTEATPDWAADFHFDENFWQELMSVYDHDFLDVSLTNAPPV